MNTANALQQYPLDMASSNKRIKQALKQAGATPSPHWSGKAGRDVYENTRAHNTGPATPASCAQRGGAKSSVRVSVRVSVRLAAMAVRPAARGSGPAGGASRPSGLWSC